MLNKINVLSLFDGMSCAQIALNKIGVLEYDYYASEIDPYSIKVSKANFPNTIQLGSVETCRDWVLPKIDLLVGGSPCQGFSFAGKGLNFQDPRSALFFKFVECLNLYQPRYFLLENVRMKKEHENVITENMGVEPIEINSALVSAQNRKRLYWTNIPHIAQPKDKGIFLKDIISTEFLDAEKIKLPLEAIHHKSEILEGMGLRLVGKACISGFEMRKRVYGIDGKAPTLTAICGGHQEPKISEDGLTWRKLTPLEFERLQTVPDNYTNYVSKAQRYKMLGNGFTVDVIAHILSHIDWSGKNA